MGKSRKEEVQEYKLAGRNSTNWQTSLLRNQNWEENSLQKCALFLFIAQVPSSPMWKSVVSLCLVGFFLSSYVQFYQRWYKHNRKLGPAAEWPCALSLVVAVLVSQHIQILLKGWKLVLGSIPWEKDLKRWFGTCQNWWSSAGARVKQHMCEEAGKGCLWESARHWLSAVRQSLDPLGLNGHRVTTSSREETLPPTSFLGLFPSRRDLKDLWTCVWMTTGWKATKQVGGLWLEMKNYAGAVQTLVTSVALLLWDASGFCQPLATEG